MCLAIKVAVTPGSNIHTVVKEAIKLYDKLQIDLVLEFPNWDKTVIVCEWSTKETVINDLKESN